MLMTAQYRANHDVLTGLANRALFDEILNHQLAICNRTKRISAVMYTILTNSSPSTMCTGTQSATNASDA